MYIYDYVLYIIKLFIYVYVIKIFLCSLYKLCKVFFFFFRRILLLGFESEEMIELEVILLIDDL